MKFTNLSSNMYKIMAFALPISAGGLVNMISSFISMMMVAKLGKQALAAGALAVSTFITIMTIAATLFYAISILISHYKGQGKSASEIGQLVKNGFWLAVLLMIPTNVLLWNIDKILLLFKQDPELIALAQGYFHYAALSMIPTLVMAVIAQFYTGIGNPRFTMFISIVSLPFIILLSYALILGKFGFPKLALAGVTFSSFIVQSLVCMGLLIYLYFGKEMRKYHIFSGGFLPDIKLCKQIFSLGLPIGVQFGGELAAMAVATYFMGFFGVMALAASQIVSQYALFIVMVTLGLTQALSVLTSEACGKKDIHLIRDYIISTIVILGIFFAFVFAAFLWIPELLIRFYVDLDSHADNELIALTISLFSIAGITLLMDSLRNILSGGLRGLQDSRAPMKIGVICLWVISLPMSYLVAFGFHGGPIGLRMGFMTGFIVASILLWARSQNKIKLMMAEKELKYEIAP